MRINFMHFSRRNKRKDYIVQRASCRLVEHADCLFQETHDLTPKIANSYSSKTKFGNS